MDAIERAELYFIFPVNRIISSDLEVKDDLFLKHLIQVQDDEFSNRLCESTERKCIFEGNVHYMNYEFPISIYLNIFNIYDSSLVYVNVHIDNRIEMQDFSNLINSTNILSKAFINDEKIIDYLYSVGIDKKEIEEVFLFCQLVEIDPFFPKDYKEGLVYIENNKQVIHQMLLRSDTYKDHLRIDNHSINFESIANFYGTIDLCSPITLLQFYQFPIKSICENNYKYDLSHRACWWLTTTDIIFIQKSVLSNTLKLLNQVQHKDKKKTIRAMCNIEKVLLNMQEYWYFEDYTHEISKKVVDKVKERVGVVSMLDSVLNRVESLENTVLREINEDQNEYNYYLNIILLMIAVIQIVPLIYEIIISTRMLGGAFSIEQLITWFESFIISISLPIIIYIVRKLNRSRTIKNSILLRKKR